MPHIYIATLFRNDTHEPPLSNAKLRLRRKARYINVYALTIPYSNTESGPFLKWMIVRLLHNDAYVQVFWTTFGEGI